MTQLLFYENIIALDRERHRDLRLDRPKDHAAFAAHTHYVPVAGGEFEAAARNYPILFTSGEGDSGPVLLFGLTAGRNPFVNGEGHWRSGTYMPAFVRRYPFVLARSGGDDYSVCIDEGYSGLTTGEGEPLFDAEGQDTDFLRRQVAFLQQYLADMERTRAFQARLEELDLLVAQDLQIRLPDGRYFTLRSFRFVDPARLDRLADEQIVQLQREGYLAWIHAHRVSLMNLAHLEAVDGDGAREPEVAEEDVTHPQAEAPPAES
jgi:hypothetical protein